MRFCFWFLILSSWALLGVGLIALVIAKPPIQRPLPRPGAEIAVIAGGDFGFGDATRRLGGGGRRRRPHRLMGPPITDCDVTHGGLLLPRRLVSVVVDRAARGRPANAFHEVIGVQGATHGFSS